MAKGKKFEAVMPDGRIAKRSSENRTYTYCVAVRLSYAAALKFAMSPDWEKCERRNFAYYASCAAGDNENAVSRPGDPEWKVKSAARAREMGERYVAEYGDADTYVSRQLAARVAGVNVRNAAGAYEKWDVVGWNSRLDLAQKLRARELSKGRAAEAVILEAKQVA